MKGNCEQGKKKREECEDDEEEQEEPSDPSLKPPKDEDETGPKLCSVKVGAMAPDNLNPNIDMFNLVVGGSSLHSKKEETVQAISSSWEVRNVPTETISHRRSRTAIEVSGRSVQEIATSLFDMNKARSIHAIYDASTVKCKTRTYLKYSIRLSKSSKDPNVIVVDVQRTAGCALKFRVEYHAVVKACQPNETTPQQAHGPISFAGLLPMDSLGAPGDDIIKDSLERAKINFKSKVYDARIIALEDLLLTTGSESKQISSTACKLILGDDEILMYVVGDIMRKGGTVVDDDDDSEEFQRSLSLNILANLLDSVNDPQTLGSFITKEHIEILTWYVDNARKNPWNACLAARCLRLLASYVNARHYSDGVYSALDDARSYGEIRYNLLEEEARHAQVPYS